MVLRDCSTVLLSRNPDKNCGSHPEQEATLNMNLQRPPPTHCLELMKPPPHTHPHTHTHLAHYVLINVWLLCLSITFVYLINSASLYSLFFVTYFSQSIICHLL